MKPHPLQIATFWLQIGLLAILLLHLHANYRISERQTRIERHLNLPPP